MKPSSQPLYDEADPAEIAKFQALAAEWWNTDGPMAPLHRMNPCRLGYITGQLRDHFKNIKDLNILDIGCGGGIVTEALARLGATMTGIDGADDLVKVAQDHAKTQNLNITYRPVLTGDLVKEKKKYDAVLALEVLEHVPEPENLIAEITQLIKPNGLVIFSTLNRTAKSFAFGVVAAEYILRWLPAGTHDWRKFIKPSELHALCTAHDLIPLDTTGMIYDALSRDFSLHSRKLNVNYFMTAKHA